MDDSSEAGPSTGPSTSVGQLGVTGPVEKNNKLASTAPQTEKKTVASINRKKRTRDKDAPKPPHTGYVRFLIEKRAAYRDNNPNATFAESTRVLANEWTMMPAEQKKPYLMDCEQERKIYLKQLQAYNNRLKTDKNNVPEKKKRLKSPPLKIKKHEVPRLTVIQEKGQSSDGHHWDDSNQVIDIPIFTEEFLNFNKSRETELRAYRKTVTDKREEFSVLQKHIEIMNNSIEKQMQSTDHYQKCHQKYDQCLNKYRDQLFNALSHISLPDNSDESPTIHTFDDYIVKLAAFMKTNDDPGLVSSIKEALVNFNIK